MKLLEEAEERIRVGLRDAISSICQTRLNYDSELSIEGLLGITLDKNEVILVSIKETLQSQSGASYCGPLDLGGRGVKTSLIQQQPPAAHSHKVTPSHKNRDYDHRDYSDVPVPLKIPKLDFMNIRSRQPSNTKAGQSRATPPLPREEQSPRSQEYIVVQPESPHDNAEDLSVYHKGDPNDREAENMTVDYSLKRNNEHQNQIEEDEDVTESAQDTKPLQKTNFPIRSGTERHKRKSDPVKCQRLDSIVNLAVERVMKHDPSSQTHTTNNTHHMTSGVMAAIAAGSSNCSSISGRQDGDSTVASPSGDSEEDTGETTVKAEVEDESQSSLVATDKQRSHSGSPNSALDDRGVKSEAANSRVNQDGDSHARWLQSIAAFVQGSQPTAAYSPLVSSVSLLSNKCLCTSICVHEIYLDIVVTHYNKI